MNKIKLFGDIGQVTLPLAAVTYSLVKRDYLGAVQMVAITALSHVAVHFLKAVVPEKRPNGGAYSFPSGHTAAAFLAPAFFVCSYGLNQTPIATGVSVALAVGVGVSRVKVRAHWPHDALAGAAVASMCALAILTPFKT